MEAEDTKGKDPATEPEEAEEELPSLDLVHEEVKDRLDVQLRQIDALDSKSGNMLFISSIVIGIGAAAQAALMGQAGSALVLLVFSIPIVLYLLAMFFALRSWVVRPYFRDPEPRPLRDYYLSKESDFTKRRIITHFISSYEWNKMVIKKKVRELRISMWFFLAEVTFLALALSLRPWLI
jgi:hypothetical protein